MDSAIVKTIYYGSMFVFAGIFLLLALIFPKKFKEVKTLFTIMSISVFIVYLFVIPLKVKLSLKTKERREAPIKAEQRAKYEQAKAVFDEQCKKAGETIYRTVDNVDGVMLINLIGEKEVRKQDAMWEDAAINLIPLYPYTAEGYIDTFLSYDVDYNVPDQKYHYWTNGYKFVDVLKKNDNSNTDENTVTRYTRVEPIKDSELNKEFQPVNSARYAVILDKNVDTELRKHWVAGDIIKIIDRQTDELLAEKAIFAFDPLQGATSNRGAPWSRADTCQEMSVIKEQGTGNFITPISNFVFTVLTPKPLFMETQNER
ncbi:MAG: hypothetical protein J6W29_04470 [Neisseriaceae bacterium]|nr:hypothetical protein [Neisseriaceae bacterium]